MTNWAGALFPLPIRSNFERCQTRYCCAFYRQRFFPSGSDDGDENENENDDVDDYDVDNDDDDENDGENDDDDGDDDHGDDDNDDTNCGLQDRPVLALYQHPGQQGGKLAVVGSAAMLRFVVSCVCYGLLWKTGSWGRPSNPQLTSDWKFYEFK